MTAHPVIAFLSLLFVASLHGAERIPWTTSRFHGSPEPPAPYQLERAFPKLTFSEPIEGTMIPGTNRFVVIGLRGKIVSFPYDDAAERTDEMADMKQWNAEVRECYSIVFHPKFAENRLAFVWVNLDLKNKPNRPDGTHLLKMRVTTDDPPRLDLAGAVSVFTCLAGGHNGGNLRFGPDGMLYFGLGDTEVPDPPDPKVTGQDISDVYASVLRIDVDREEDGRRYAIPKDNPFVQTPGARGEVWAYGFRNPWRLAFSPEGELWLGDVGWELWESVIRVERGGNYGWSITEASRQDVRPDRLRGPTPILPPTYAHSHEEAASITGGEFYAGKKLPELRGTYLYGDWQTGTFWSLVRKPAGQVEVREMCRSSLLPVGFGLGADGEVIAFDQVGGGLWRFARNPDAGRTSNFPRKLSDTGLFSDVAKQTPAPGVLPYATKTPRWADGAKGETWVALPETSAITIAKKEHGVIGKGRWVYPKDTVLTKTYTIETTPGVQRKVETQLLHFDGIQWGAYSYQWNAAQTDADLVGPRGADTTIDVRGEPKSWRFFSRSECLRCHNMWTNFSPGFSPTALDQDHLTRFAGLGLLPDAKPKPPGYAEEPNGSDPIHVKAREYLNANCGACHRFGGGGSVRILLDSSVKTAEMRLHNETPLQGDMGLPEARLLAPGDPGRSVILQRMATGGRGHMPYLGGRTVDDAGLALIRDWIGAMPAVPGGKEVVARRALEQNALAEVRGGSNQSAIETSVDLLFGSGSGALDLALGLADRTIEGRVRESVIAKGSALADPLRRDLFERHLPAAQRRKILGATFDRHALLALAGDATRGRAQFLAVCAACHRHRQDGIDFGPDLSKIAAKYQRPDLLTHITDPAKLIEPDWQLVVVTMKDNTTTSGFVSTRNDEAITMRLAGGATSKLPVAEIASTTTQRVSLMPEGLLASLTPQEAADLLAFLLQK